VVGQRAIDGQIMPKRSAEIVNTFLLFNPGFSIRYIQRAIFIFVACVQRVVQSGLCFGLVQGRRVAIPNALSFPYLASRRDIMQTRLKGARLCRLYFDAILL
jgi:hypothetical protein